MTKKGAFAAKVRLFAEDTLRRLDTVRRAASLELFNSVILSTPVATGRLRANWQTSIGRPDVTVTFENDTSGRGAMARAAAVVDKSTSHEDVWLCNSLPYAETAEFGLWNGPTELVTDAGFSRKAPAGMVRVNLARMDRIIDARAKTEASK